MLICTLCSTAYEPPRKKVQTQYVGLCPKCRQKKYYQAHIEKDKGRYLQRARFYHKKRTYGIDAKEFATLYERQQGQGPICNTEFPPLVERTQKIAVDHDHVTGKVRALLCSRCNTAIAMVREDINIAQNIILYLQSHGTAQ